METPKLDFFLGKIREVKDRVTYEVTVDVPGLGEELKAYPYSRGEMDEPVSGNLVYLLSLDPTYHSVFLYTKAKENDFIGIRSNGKAIDITPEAIIVGTYDAGGTNEDSVHPDCSGSYIKMDSSGNIEIMATGEETVKISGNASIEISGDANIKVSGSCNLDSPDVNVTGSSLTVKGTPPPEGKGPFCAVPNCIFSGAPHSSTKSLGN